MSVCLMVHKAGGSQQSWPNVSRDNSRQCCCTEPHAHELPTTTKSYAVTQRLMCIWCACIARDVNVGAKNVPGSDRCAVCMNVPKHICWIQAHAIHCLSSQSSFQAEYLLHADATPASRLALSDQQQCQRSPVGCQCGLINHLAFTAWLETIAKGTAGRNMNITSTFGLCCKWCSFYMFCSVPSCRLALRRFDDDDIPPWTIICAHIPTLDNNLDRVYYSFKTDFRMEPYLTQLHLGPLRTTLARFRLGQHWLLTRLGRFGPHREPYESRWCQHCALVNQHKAVDSEEHALFECPLHHDLWQQQPWAQQQPCNLQAFMALPPLQ